MTRQILNFTTNNLEDLSSTGVYSIINKLDNKFYVGSTTVVGKCLSISGFYYRWTNHIYRLKRNEHHSKKLQYAWNKYGAENFEFEIIEFVEPEKCIEAEQLYLDVIAKSKHLAYNTCFVAGNCTGVKQSEETKQKRAKSLLDKGTINFSVVSPEGEIINGTNCAKFCKERGLDNRSFSEMLLGRKFHYSGWTSNLINHLKYKEDFNLRGISYYPIKKVWRVKTKGSLKSFRTLEDAKIYRDKLASLGKVWRVQTRLRTKQINHTHKKGN